LQQEIVLSRDHVAGDDFGCREDDLAEVIRIDVAMPLDANGDKSGEAEADLAAIESGDGDRPTRSASSRLVRRPSLCRAFRMRRSIASVLAVGIICSGLSSISN
jgi:hypothetical protein